MRIIILFNFLMWLQLLSPVFADDLTKQRVSEEYLKEAKHLSIFFDQCTGIFEHSWIEDKKPKKLVVSFSRAENTEKFEIQFNLEIGSRTETGTGVYSITKDGAFDISKLDREKDYNLNKVSMSKLEREMIEVDYARIARAPLGGYQKSLLQMIDSGLIKLKDAKLNSEKPNLIEATYTATGNSPIKEIDVVFDSAQHWVVTRQILKVGEKLKVATDYQVEYDLNGSLGVPTPKSVKTEKSTNPYFFKDWKFQAVPAEQFKLPFYGLPDVIDKNKRRIIGPVELILSGLIITFLGLGILFYRLSSRPHKRSE